MFVLVSCSKEKIGTNQPAITEEIATAKGGGSSNINLNKGLEGWFQFNGNLVEKTGKLADAYASTTGADVYTEDRNGNPNSAVNFNGRYRLGIINVPHANNMSTAAWVRYDSASAWPSAFVVSMSDGPSFMQAFDKYYGYNNPAGNPWITSGTIDTHWHHLVTTIDGTNLKFYVDGNLISSIVSPDVYAQSVAYYVIGSGYTIDPSWHGAIDDLRFYTKTLSASEVQALFNL